MIIIKLLILGIVENELVSHTNTMNSHLQRKELKQNSMLIHILDRINSKKIFFTKTHVQMLTSALNNYYIVKEAFRSQVITAT